MQYQSTDITDSDLQETEKAIKKIFELELKIIGHELKVSLLEAELKAQKELSNLLLKISPESSSPTKH